MNKEITTKEDLTEKKLKKVYLLKNTIRKSVAVAGYLKQTGNNSPLAKQYFSKSSLESLSL